MVGEFVALEPMPGYRSRRERKCVEIHDCSRWGQDWKRLREGPKPGGDFVVFTLLLIAMPRG